MNNNTSFAKLCAQEANYTHTENGQKALNNTNSACLDLFATAGALREASPVDVASKLQKAWAEDPRLTTKIALYTRDIRGGLGERDVGRFLMSRVFAKITDEAIGSGSILNVWGSKILAKEFAELIMKYGRGDDIYSCVGCSYILAGALTLFQHDLYEMKNGGKVSLLAKWLASPDASSKKTRSFAHITASAFGMTTYEYKRKLKALRKYIDITEQHMSANDWSNIDYSKVPSYCMNKSKAAFARHDNTRFVHYLINVENGAAEIKSGVLYPYDLIHSIMSCTKVEARVAEAQWKALPDYFEGKAENMLVLADVSGSMAGRPIESSIGLAIYAAEHNTGEWHNLSMVFSSDSQFVKFSDSDTLEDKMLKMESFGGYYGSTNIKAAFDAILTIAIEHNVAKEDMIKSLVIVSDMEFDAAISPTIPEGRWSHHAPVGNLLLDLLEKEWNEAGYELPNIIFWNVNSRNDTYHADADRPKVQLLSGNAATAFTTAITGVGLTPYEAMLKTLEKYDDDATSIVSLFALS